MNFKTGDLVVYVHTHPYSVSIFEPGSVLEVLHDDYHEENTKEGYPPQLRVRLRFGAARMDWAATMPSVYISARHVRPFDEDTNP
jgi:hypothetical protein